MTEPHPKENVRAILHPIVEEWFFSKFPEFSLPQLYGILEIHNLNNILVTAPTGSGKTLTSTLAIINELVTLAWENLLENRVYAIYTNPLRALSNDVEVNLKKPIEEIEALAKKQGKELNIRIAVRTGDTSVAKKAAMLKKPPHILICTPESLAIMILAPKFREHLAKVQYCILDEIHSLAENKRGVHLSLTLERLQHVIQQPMTRIGLSATIAPLSEIAQFLVGTDRDCKIADARFLKQKDFKVISPVKDLINTTFAEQHNSLYTLLHELIQSHKTTLIFTNTRSATERVVHTLKQRFPSYYEGKIGAHHGSLSKSTRMTMEAAMRSGLMKVGVTSTSLELGIDIGFIDLVICLGSPKSIARMSQRFGRAGHKLHDAVVGRLIVLDRDDLVECSIMVKEALDNKIDRIHIPQNALDVLAQQVHGMSIEQHWKINEAFALIKRSYCYRSLKAEDFKEIVNYLAGEHVSLEERNVYAKMWYDPEIQEFGKRGKLGRVIHMTNVGTIPDEASVIVKLGEHVIGTIEEAFLERLKKGDIFVLGGDTYQFSHAKGMVAYVRAASGKSPTVPSWFSEMLPLSFDLAMDIQKFRRYMEDHCINHRSKEEMLAFIASYLGAEGNAAEAIYRYFREQYLYAKIPHDKRLLIEHYTDEKGKRYAVFHALYGRRVNDVLSRVIGYVIGKVQKHDVELGLNDNGFYIASPKPFQPVRAFEFLRPEELRKIAELSIEGSEVMRRRFRHCATRALMILRQYKGRTKRVGRQQVSSMILMHAVKRLNKDFCILKEAKREVLEDMMDIEHAEEIIRQVKTGKIEIEQIQTTIPSPFAFNLVLQGYTDVLKMEDKIAFLRRMHQQVLAKIGKTHGEVLNEPVNQ